MTTAQIIIMNIGFVIWFFVGYKVGLQRGIIRMYKLFKNKEDGQQ